MLTPVEHTQRGLNMMKSETNIHKETDGLGVQNERVVINRGNIDEREN